MNVLAVDDQINVLNGLMVGVQWKKLGIDQVYKAGNAAEAKRILRACTVDILMSDIEMPGESGLQLLEWVRNEQMDIACIFLTAHADFTYAKTAMRLDSVDYILQPASYTQIEESIQRVIDKINARRIQDTYASYGKRIIRDNESFEKMVVNQWPLEEKLPSTWGENAEEDNIQKIKQVKQYIQQNLDRELHREEIAEQVRALNNMKKMAEAYGYDISKPATNAREAFQWLYFGYLAAIKTQNGAAMSVGRISTFLDIYIERDLANGTLTESEAQELVDHIVMKFRMVKFARIPSYNALFSGDPVWATLEVAGLGTDGRSMVTKNDYRFLHTLEDMGPSPEPNLTVLYTEALPENFKKYAAKISIDTSSIQYENDDVMRPVWGDDYSICCCVSATQTGKEMQFFGARANLAKCLTYAINGGVDEKTKQQVGPEYRGITSEYLDYDEVIKKYENMMGWLADLYVNTLNLIQYMHDKYYYEAAEMALIDTDVRRTFATGIAGFSHVVDSLSAIKYAKVKTIRDEDGIVVDYEVEGDFPRYGNDDDRADNIAVWLLHTFLEKIKQHHTYRNSEPTTSILTITSNVVYGKATGSLPDGRKAGEPLSPGANPSYGAEKNGLLASLNSVAKLPYEWALDGISNTQTIAPSALGHDEAERADKLVTVMDGYFRQGAHHLNVNVFGKEKLIDAMEHPEKPEYANFTIRVSGYAVKFIDLTREQQLDVIARTCHDHM